MRRREISCLAWLSMSKITKLRPKTVVVSWMLNWNFPSFRTHHIADARNSRFLVYFWVDFLQSIWGLFGLIRAKWNNNFLSGFLARLNLFRERTFHPWRRSPHYIQHDSRRLTPLPPATPRQTPHFSLQCWPWFFKKSRLPKFHCCFDNVAVNELWETLVFLSSLWCLCLLNHAALGRSKGTVLLLSFSHVHVFVAHCMFTGNAMCYVCV